MAVTLDQFIRSLTASGLMTPEEFKAFRRTLPPEQQPVDVPGLAKVLVQAGKLTKYQAGAVYQGKIKGLILGEYVVLDRIGAGGMGEVLKARHRRMKREVALKVLPPKSLKSPDAVRRFYREVEAIARLSHPNIVTAYDANEHHGIHYLVMEYVDGQDLSSLVKTHGPLSIQLALECMVQAARGLEYAHRQGVVHRDIKPSNLLLDRSGTVKVLDMGLALVRIDAGPTGEDRLTGSGEVMGTCDYMAPEQAEDMHLADHRADIYSLGCTLYRLLVGKAPYPGETIMQVLLAHRTALIPSLGAVRPDVPAPLELIFRRMMAKRPEDRQQSMSEVIRELEACLRAEQSAEDTPSADSTDMALKSFLQNLPPIGVAAQKKTTQSALEETVVYQAEESTSPGAASSASGTFRKPRSRAVAIGATAALLAVAGLLIVLFGGRWGAALRTAAERQSASTVAPTGQANTGSGGIVTILWPATDRADARLEIDGEIQDLAGLAGESAEGQLRVSLPAGEHRLWIARRGYEPFERRFVVRTNDALVIEPVWQAAAEAVVAEEAPPESPEPAPEQMVDVPPAAEQAPQPAPEPSPVPGESELPAPAAPDPGELAALERQMSLEAKYAEVMNPVEKKLAAWDFRGALGAMKEIRPENEELRARLSARWQEIRQMEAFKTKVIARIISATPRLKKSDLKIRGLNGEIVEADEQKLTARLANGSSEAIAWKDLGRVAVPEVLELGIDKTAGADWLAAGLTAFALGHVESAERFLGQAQSRGVDTAPYLVSLARGTFMEVVRFLEEKQYAKASSALDRLQQHYGATPWYMANAGAIRGAQVQVAAGIREQEAEKLFAEAVKLYEKKELYDLRELVASLESKYGDSTVVTTDSRRPSFAQMKEAVAEVGKKLIVRKDGKGDFTTVQAAIDAAEPNSLIEIEDHGPYNEWLVFSAEKRSISLRGKRGAWPLITTAGTAQAITNLISAVGLESIRFDGLVLYHTNAGAGGYCAQVESCKRSMFRSCVIFGRESNVRVVRGSSVLLEACVGGGETGAEATSDLVARDSLFVRGYVRGERRTELDNVVAVAGSFPAQGSVTRCTINMRMVVEAPLDKIVDSILPSAQANMPVTLEYCNVYENPPFIDAARPGKGCFSAPPMFVNPERFDFRLMPNSPCRGKASDGGDVGCRYTPEMIEILDIALKLRTAGVLEF